ncbi:gliding motility protein GldC [Aureibaculum sp. 2210JD6-5]|uniref:gliding motility protein GldC n=1 Tax=Aureibaculum sp. 2210JD6-5 TaxID=3103957 RepID=UPI002AACE60B|nr:gliding motility protein GldC [Aureibaculum sp. 2210JD6-5]MDY7396270.1 gliding motility protein GldC [Aureibaculum sp. 2210JD6-5]
MTMKTSEIKFTVELDENKIPEKLKWDAKDGGIENESTKAVLISVWDDKKKETLKMDLWTKDMPLNEMQHFFHQTLLSMSDTFLRATNDEKMTATMRDFCEYFAEKLELLEK